MPRELPESQNYKLIVAPALHIIDESTASRLMDFVKNGGHLVLTIRTGMKDESNAMLPMRQPGLLAEMAGVEVDEFYALDKPVTVTGNWFKGESSIWAERLKVRDEKQTIVIARYDTGHTWLAGLPAITVHPFGRGMVYTVGAYLDNDAQRALLAHISKVAEARPVFETPPWVEACRRTTPDGKQVYIVINHDEANPHEIKLPWPALNHLTSETVESLTLAPYQTALLTKNG
jgi:beta-galactosidase